MQASRWYDRDFEVMTGGLRQNENALFPLRIRKASGASSVAIMNLYISERWHDTI